MSPHSPFNACGQMTDDQELLDEAIKASGLSARRFAEDVLSRDERTVRRWRAGKSPIPKAVVEFLKKRQAAE